MNIEQRVKSKLPLNDITSIAGLERSCGVSTGTIGKWGKGEYKPSAQNLKKIADVLCVSTDWLLTGEESLPFQLMRDFPTLWSASTLEEKTSIAVALVNEIVIENKFEMPKDLFDIISKSKNIILGDVSGSAFVQGTNRGTVTVHNGGEHTISQEAAELLRIYESLNPKERHKLLGLAFEVEEKSKGGNT